MLHFCQEHHRNRFKDAIESIEDALITKILENVNDKNEDGKDTDLEAFSLIEHINDIRTMSRTLLKHINKICDEEIASHLCRTVLLHKKANEQLPPEEIEQLRTYLANIALFANIGRATAITELLPCDTWTKVMEINRVEPGRLLYSLIERSQYEICYQWLQTEPIQNTTIKTQLMELFVIKIQDSRNTKNPDFIAICKILLKILVVQMDSKLLLRLKNQELLQYLVDFLIENALDNENKHIYNNYNITLKIFEVIDAKEIETLWTLAETPLLIIEQYIINSKFETLSKIIRAVRPHIKDNECKFCDKLITSTTTGDSREMQAIMRDLSSNNKNHIISNDCIDRILRIYASKALEFHIGNAQVIAPERPSLDSERGSFKMPRDAPHKSRWV